ncbi:hypothetical protein JTB14_002369 [Gonioctena quinquepunctata]|nr:hypothetical protein JTB14_002369 [Gonioctena quinquepunctata]KAG5878975.1 hypothetical protein JTB14_002369 [Gonioctena quinquepunctata]
MRQFYLFLCVGIISSETAILDHPAHFPRCRRTDPKLEDCQLAATEKVRPDMIKGVPDFFRTANLTVPKVVIQRGNRAINFKASLNDVTLVGLENFKFTRFKYDVARETLFTNIDLPRIYPEGEYDLKGNIFFVPIGGKGHFFVNLNQATKNLVDKNMDVVIEELMPAVEEVLGKLFDQLVFEPVTRIPYDKLHPK